MQRLIAGRPRKIQTTAFALVAVLALSLSAMLTLGSPEIAYACSCIQPGTPLEELEKFSAVFAGKVVSIEHSYDPDAETVTLEDRTTVGFDVSTVWKGTVHEDMYITTPPTGGSCGFTFAEGVEYIVYAHESAYPEGGYTVGLCSRTAFLALAQEDTEALGEGDAPLAGTGGPAPAVPQPVTFGGSGVDFTFNFNQDAEGWIVGFADLPVNHDQSTFELDHGHRQLPDGLEGSGIFIQGHNRSDDLFMFLKRQVEGLRPNTQYMVQVSIDLATNVPAGLVGIGGAPGESVFVKAGASTDEPIAVEGDNQHLRLSIDKGNQAQSGESMVVIGDVASPDVADSEYQIKNLSTGDRTLSVEADSEGRVWLIVGTDSGFEGLTSLYYSRIAYTLSTAELPPTGDYWPSSWTIAMIAGAGLAVAALGAALFAIGRRPSAPGHSS